MNPQYLKKLCLTLALTCCLVTTATAGQFFRTAGDTTDYDAGKKGTITISTMKDAGGHLYPNITRHSGNQTWVRSMTSLHLKPESWFIFIEDASHIWIFDGNDTLDVLIMTDKEWTTARGAEDLKSCPKEVRDTLPEAVRKKYFDKKS